MKVERGVNVLAMIPERFFQFGELQRYEKCNSLEQVSCDAELYGLTCVGRRELLEVREEDLDDRAAINEIENRAWSLFTDLLEIRQKEPEYRALNMARKRSDNKSSAGVSLDSSETSLGILSCIQANSF